MSEQVLVCPDCRCEIQPTDHFCVTCGSGAAFEPPVAVAVAAERGESAPWAVAPMHRIDPEGIRVVPSKPDI